jgi:hypothetical protein
MRAAVQYGWSRDVLAPLGVATYRLTDALPNELKGSLPTIDGLENTLPPLPTEENGDE